MHRIRPAITVVAIVFVAMMAFFGSGSAAHAATGSKYWGSTYVNAWDGGPNINAYHGVSSNDQFTLVAGSSIYESLMLFAGGGGYNNYCVGDAGNQQGSARAALSYCANGSIPWGANIQVKTCSTNSNKVSFYDTHWQGYIAPSALSDGSAFYLNHPGEWCYTPS